MTVEVEVVYKGVFIVCVRKKVYPARGDQVAWTVFRH